MIWFGNLERFFVGAVPAGLPATAEFTRMQLALERVAEVAPGLTGTLLVDALAATGWVDRPTAERLRPHFRQFDPDRHFAEYLRRLSFRGPSAEGEFHSAIRCVVEEIAGSGSIGRIGPEACIRFSNEDREGVVLARPEVGFTISGKTRDAVLAAVEEMPDVLVVVARSFEKGAEQQLSSLLYRTGLRGTLVTVNHLIGVRATTLRYQPDLGRVLELLAIGRTLRSADIARLADRELATAAVA